MTKRETGRLKELAAGMKALPVEIAEEPGTFAEPEPAGRLLESGAEKKQTFRKATVSLDRETHKLLWREVGNRKVRGAQGAEASAVIREALAAYLGKREGQGGE